MSRFDTHVHLWRRGDGHPVRIRSRVPELDADFDMHALRPLLASAEISRLILVSAAQIEAEPAGLLIVAEAHRDVVAGVIGWLDLAVPDFEARLAAACTNPLWLGLRLPVVLEDAETWVAQPGLDDALAALADVGAVIQVLVAPHQIATVATVLERHTGLRIVIDHVANPDLTHPGDPVWHEGIARLARLPNAFAKLSMLWLPGQTLPDEAALAAIFAHVARQFGHHRLLAASNWPVSAPGFAYRDVFATIERLTGLDAGRFAANAEAIYTR
ncbi:L-fuconolactonase [Devosia enhydra]|uniref:L-fuconolactonase n=1 Tax=Devosia enhydra TaxID=665118 RepID=A0A1K2HS55_9HYPH|nr:amidohydrolase family protein [Devosia enhydra]SFZ80609.1 L-fuconolactonase [Devosia enhydra]